MVGRTVHKGFGRSFVGSTDESEESQEWGRERCEKGEALDS